MVNEDWRVCQSSTMRKTMKTEMRNISPLDASRLMEVNCENRKIRTANVKFWEGILESGQYQPTHQGIAISGTWENPSMVVDGQHRLQAIVNTGITAMFNVSTEVSDSTFANVDCGLTRSMNDRTGIPVKSIQVCAFFVSLLKDEKTKPRVDEINQVYEILKDHMTFRGFNIGMRGLTTAGIRAAFVLYHMKHHDKNIYHNFYSGDFDSLTPSLKSLYRRLLTNPFGGGSDGQIVQFVAAYKCLLVDTQMKKIVAPVNCKSDAIRFASSHITYEKL